MSLSVRSIAVSPSFGLKRIIVNDTTLRDGEQAPGAAMTLRNKLNVARQLNALRLDGIELGFPTSSKGDATTIRKIAEEIGKSPKGAFIYAFARGNYEDVNAVWDALQPVHENRRGIQIVIPTSDRLMKTNFSKPKTRDDILQMIHDSVTYAKQKGFKYIQFAPEDSSRADQKFLLQALETAVKAGATVLNLPDTTGYILPHEIAEQVRKVRAMIGSSGVSHPVKILIHGHDDIGLATANALAAIQAGADGIDGTINGIGERAGNTAIEEVLGAIKARGNALGLTTTVNTKRIGQTSDVVVRECGLPVAWNKAIVGANAFRTAAGIHQRGVTQGDHFVYNNLDAKDFGRQSSIVLGMRSGTAGLQAVLKEQDIKMDPEKGEMNKLVNWFKKPGGLASQLLTRELRIVPNSSVIELAEAIKDGKSTKKLQAVVRRLVKELTE